ncbi:hypothetical protein C8R43DRAFT_229479 [Mycena crocata]|nr:hypothetical protein C8R43DRAFT_229479 [Mycena crocata]
MAHIGLDYDSLVAFELKAFPNAPDAANIPGPASPKLNLKVVDNYLPVLDAMLAWDRTRYPEGISESHLMNRCRALPEPARHVLAVMVLQRNAETWHYLKKLDCRQDDAPLVMSTLCEAEAFCVDEKQDVFVDVLKKLEIDNLKELAQKHRLKLKATALKSEYVEAFRKSHPASLFGNSQQVFRDKVMLDVIPALNESNRRSLKLNANVWDAIEPRVKEYFESIHVAPAHISKRVFNNIRRNFLDV